MKIRSVGAEPFHGDGRTDRRTGTHDEASSRLSQFGEYARKGCSPYKFHDSTEEAKLHSFITWALDGDEWSASCSGHCTSVETVPGTPRKELIDHTAGLDVSKKRIISCRYKCTLAKFTTPKIHCPTDIIPSEEKQLWVTDQLDAQLRYIMSLLLEYSTCFEQLCAHHQEVKLY